MDELPNFTKRYGVYPVRFRSTDFYFADSTRGKNMENQSKKVETPKLTVKDRIRIFKIQHKDEINFAEDMAFGAAMAGLGYLLGYGIGKALGYQKGLNDGFQLGVVTGEHGILKGLIKHWRQ